MKIYYGSDLHIDHSSYLMNSDIKGDLLILAGDIVSINKLEDSLNYFNAYSMNDHIIDFFNDISQKFERIIYVAGNHEFYGSSLSDISRLKTIIKQWDNIIILDNETIEINGIKIYGGVMWTDIDNGDPLSMIRAKSYMMDYRAISGLLPIDTIIEHEKFLKNMPEDMDIIISHHAPSYGCISEKYQNNINNGLFCSEVDIKGAKYWIYGHMHGGLSIDKDGCHILNNSRGYRGESCYNGYTIKYFEYEEQ